MQVWKDSWWPMHLLQSWLSGQYISDHNHLSMSGIISYKELPCDEHPFTILAGSLPIILPIEKLSIYLIKGDWYSWVKTDEANDVYRSEMMQEKMIIYLSLMV